MKKIILIFTILVTALSFGQNITELKQKAQKGDPEAQYNLGLYYYDRDKRIIISKEKAVYWFEKAAKKGHIKAQFQLGAMNYRFNDAEYPISIEKTKYWLEQAAEQGNPSAQYELGFFYIRKEGMHRNEKTKYWFTKAFHSSTQAAEQGDAEAQFILGSLYETSYHVIEYSREKSRYWFTKAAEQGHAKAQYGLSSNLMLYSPIDVQKSLYWKKKAAEQGLFDAQHSMQSYYERGIVNLEEIAHWYPQYVEKIDTSDNQYTARILYNLAVKYRFGEGIEESREKAFYWSMKAAKKGFARAQFYTGLLYHNGDGVKQSNEKAVYWYKKAAEQGNSDGQHSLGLMYKLGLGVKKSNEKAKYWLQKACDNGEESACRDLEDL